MRKLIMAIQYDKKKYLAEYFAEKEINSYFKYNTQRTTALFLAAAMGKTQTIKTLLELGADVNFGNDTALMLAARFGHNNTVELLLKNGANPNAQNGKAIYFSSTNKHFIIGSILKDNGLSKEASTNSKLIQACVDGSLERVNKNIKAGADIHVWDDAPLRKAIHYKHKEVVSLLLDLTNEKVSNRVIKLLKIKKWYDLAKKAKH